MKVLITNATFVPSLDGPQFLDVNTFADMDEESARGVVQAGKGLHCDKKDDKTRGKIFTASQEQIDAAVAASKAAEAAAKPAGKSAAKAAEPAAS